MENGRHWITVSGKPFTKIVWNQRLKRLELFLVRSFPKLEDHWVLNGSRVLPALVPSIDDCKVINRRICRYSGM
jgi:hypothetical protein